MASNRVKEITASEFTTLIGGPRPVLVDFFATWCGPCKAMEPVVERVANRFAGRVEVVKVNIDKFGELAAEYRVHGVPTFMLFAGGRIKGRLAGVSSERTLAALIEPHLDPSERDTRPLVAA